MRVIADHRMDENNKAELLKLGFQVVPTVTVGAVYDEIKGHADIQLHPVNNKVICAPEVYGYYKKMLDNLTDLITDEFKQTITYDDIILMAVNHLYLQLCYPTNEYQRLIRNDILNEYKTGLAPLWDTVIGNDIDILEG